MEKTLIGFRRGISKKTGRSYCSFKVSTPCTAQDNASGAYGINVQEFFAPEEYVDYFQPGDIGKPVTLDFNISNNRAYVVYINVNRK